MFKKIAAYGSITSLYLIFAQKAWGVSDPYVAGGMQPFPQYHYPILGYSDYSPLELARMILLPAVILVVIGIVLVRLVRKKTRKVKQIDFLQKPVVRKRTAVKAGVKRT